jgi:Cu(I)/Ag(I) efflux system membrane fusion protein
MDLVPVTKDDSGALKVNPETVRLVGVGVGEVDYLPLVRTIWTVGKVDYDETRVKYVASRVQGRVERLHIDFQGSKVIKGEPLLAIYSPDLVTALEEYRASLRADAATASIGALARSAEMRLKLWGLDEREIRQLLASDAASAYEIPVRSPISGTVIEKNVFEGKYVKEGENLYVVADLSRVWITAEVYEGDIADVMLGDMVMVTARAHPHEMFHGKVAFIDPYVNEHTRAAGIRIEVNNADEKLKPGMYVEAKLEVPVRRDEGVFWICPMHPDVVAKGPGECPECGMFLEKVAAGTVLAVPRGAVIHTADVAQVYVERDEGIYEVRQVELGEVSTVKGGGGEYYPVRDGLFAHERVVTDASFLIHSQARLTGKAASAYGGALDVETPVIHQH